MPGTSFGSAPFAGDFAAGDGQISCDHRTCETATRLSGNVETYRRWVEMLREESAARA